MKILPFEPEYEEIDPTCYYLPEMLGKIEPIFDDEMGEKRSEEEIKILNFAPH